MHIRVLRDQRPIEPIRLVVMTVGIVIAMLRSPNLIAHREHRQTKRKRGDGEKVLHLTVPESFGCRIIRRTLDTTVPTSIIISAVAVVFAVGLVVFLVVRDQVVECESVV